MDVAIIKVKAALNAMITMTLSTELASFATVCNGKTIDALSVKAGLT